MDLTNIKFIDEVEIKDKRVLLRVDFNVTLNPDKSIADDARIKQSLPTIDKLIGNNNQVIILSHLGRPEGKRTDEFSMKIVVEKLAEIYPSKKVELIEDFTKSDNLDEEKDPNVIYVLENIRFYKEEKLNEEGFSNKLAGLADVYVNDGFAVCHRVQASVVGVTKFIDSYGGLLLKKELEILSQFMDGDPERPVTAIIGGAKIATKMNVITKLMDVADHILIGGGLANTFLAAQGYEIAHSFYEYEWVEQARQILFHAAQKNAAIHLPGDVVIGETDLDKNGEYVKKVEEIDKDDKMILDIGPETQARYGSIITKSGTVIWNGPIGYVEKPAFKRGTDFIYYTLAENTEAKTIVGGGDTLSAISKKEYLENIDHISTGGGAMLELIEKGTLPGIEALRN